VKFAEYTEKKKPVILPYTLHDNTLRTTEKAKYLRVTISSNLNWSSHINTITNKAKNSLRFKETKCQSTKQTTKRGCIQNICTPQVENYSTIWHPWQKHLTHIIEFVQRWAARYVQNDYHYTSSVTNMFRELKWSTVSNAEISQFHNATRNT